MIYDLIDFIKGFLKVVGVILMIILLVLALPKMIEQAQSDNYEQPYSGATPDCPRHIDEDCTSSY
jgi:hypothetical protein